MLSKIKFQNFYSFGDEFEISWKVGKKPSSSYFDITLNEDGDHLNKVTAVHGPNGAGRTQMLRPQAFLSWFISQSITAAEPDEAIPFKPHVCRENQTTRFELDFIIDNHEYRYKLEATPQAVIHESLHKKTSHLYSYLFVGDKVDDTYEFKQKGLSFNIKLAVNVRQNASIISSAHMNDVKEVHVFTSYFVKIISNTNVSGRRLYHVADLLESARFLQKDEA